MTHHPAARLPRAGPGVAALRRGAGGGDVDDGGAVLNDRPKRPQRRSFDELLTRNATFGAGLTELEAGAVVGGQCRYHLLEMLLRRDLLLLDAKGARPARLAGVGAAGTRRHRGRAGGVAGGRRVS